MPDHYFTDRPYDCRLAIRELDEAGYFRGMAAGYRGEACTLPDGSTHHPMAWQEGWASGAKTREFHKINRARHSHSRIAANKACRDSTVSKIRGLTDSEVVDEASRMIRFGAAAMVQMIPDEPHYMFYGPGFEVKVSRTDPAADYPGKPL